MQMQVMKQATTLRDRIAAATPTAERPWERAGVLPKIWHLPPIEVIVMQTQDLLIHEPGAVTVADAI